tara:strand:+ start:1136 stop:1339 length:204 start_codon:yes stop_codon:yes gene_type:complete
MKIITIFLFSAIMIFLGFLLGLSIRIKNSEDDVKESFKKGYIDGYMDASGKKEDDPYYKDFPKMGIN